MDLSIFTSVEAWVSLISLIFLEIVLGVDNLVFITITCDRLPKEKESLGRKLGLLGALVSRIIFLSFASWLVHMNDKLFTVPLGSFEFGLSIRDLIMLCGGAYLIYKGITELRDVNSPAEESDPSTLGRNDSHQKTHQIGLAHAIATIMAMDVVFSIDSVITAVGLADHLVVMILAVMIAVLLMMLFIDPISNFINKHVEMKMLALVFITVIGALLILDGFGINSGIEIFEMHAEKLMVYCGMVIAFVVVLIRMRRTSLQGDSK